MATENQKSFCRAVYQAAQRLNEISPVFVAAQACLESGWGASAIATYNIFGITRGQWPADRCVLVTTTEVFPVANKKFTPPEKVLSIQHKNVNKYVYRVVRYFKRFRSYDECLQEHLRLFQKPGYADAWPYRKNAREFARRIADNKGCKYATDPHYQQVMEAMIASVENIVK